MIAIVDYDAGNIASVEKAFLYLGKEVVVTRDPEVILKADHIVLPGVGAYADCMNKLIHYHLIDTLHEVVKRKIPLLGICLGLQLLFDYSEEGGHVPGLGILPGTITLIPKKGNLKIPQIGWNSIEIQPESRLFEGIANHSYVYFVHSYYLKAKDQSMVAATTEYGVQIHAAIETEHIYACQFHPEKSGTVGLKILENFSKL